MPAWLDRSRLKRAVASLLEVSWLTTTSSTSLAPAADGPPPAMRRFDLLTRTLPRATWSESGPTAASRCGARRPRSREP